MATPTYTLIASNTLTSASNTVTFSSIPATYTDLIMFTKLKASGGSVDIIYAQYNSDSSSIYSSTRLTGSAGTLNSDRQTNGGTGWFVGLSSPDEFNAGVYQFSNYADTNIFKSAISRDTLVGNQTRIVAGLWRSTSAIDSISIINGNANTFVVGSIFTLYGIKAE
jgi:hypothetical protein